MKFSVNCVFSFSIYSLALLGLALLPYHVVFGAQTGWLQTITYAGNDKKCTGDIIQVTNQGVGVCFQTDVALWTQIVATETSGVITATTTTYTDDTCAISDSTDTLVYTKNNCTLVDEDYTLVYYTSGTVEPSYPSSVSGPLVT